MADVYQTAALPETGAEARLYGGAGSKAGAIFVGGVGGGWDSPARGLYPALCAELEAAAMAALRIRFRNPTHLQMAAEDVLAGVRFLQQRGVERVGLVGHSFGGAVAIRAAAPSPAVSAVATLATQTHGAAQADRLGPRCALLLVHGRDDDVLPAAGSEALFQAALEPKRLVLLDRGGHLLDEAADEVRPLVRDWLVERLARS